MPAPGTLKLAPFGSLNPRGFKPPRNGIDSICSICSICSAFYSFAAQTVGSFHLLRRSFFASTSKNLVSSRYCSSPLAVCRNDGFAGTLDTKVHFPRLIRPSIPPTIQLHHSQTPSFTSDHFRTRGAGNPNQSTSAHQTN